MDHISIFPGTAPYKAVKQLYLSAFPPEERQPFFRLWLLSVLRPQVQFWAYVDNSAVVSFKFFIVTERYLYSLFTAVDPACQNMGYGSRILTDLRAHFPDKAIIFEIEQPDETAENYSQRLRRLEFFQRNGFYLLDHTIAHDGVTYVLMSSSTDYDRDAYLRCFRHLSLRPDSLLKNLIEYRKQTVSI